MNLSVVVCRLLIVLLVGCQEVFVSSSSVPHSSQIIWALAYPALVAIAHAKLYSMPVLVVGWPSGLFQVLSVYIFPPCVLYLNPHARDCQQPRTILRSVDPSELIELTVQPGIVEPCSTVGTDLRV